MIVEGIKVAAVTFDDGTTVVCISNDGEADEAVIRTPQEARVVAKALGRQFGFRIVAQSKAERMWAEGGSR